MEYLNMHNQSKWIVPGLLVLAVTGTGVHAAETSAGSAAASPARLEQRRLINRVDHGRQEIERRGDALVREANLKLVSGDYMGACSLYRKAKMEFKKFNSPYFTRRIAFCDSQISKCYFVQAQDAMRAADRSAQRGDFETAIKLCREALKYCPEQADQLEMLIQQYEKRKNYVIERDKTTAGQLLPNQKNQEYQIEILLEQGRKLIAANELGAAIRKYEEILLLDPYNAAAIKSLEAVYLRIDKIGAQRYNATHRRLLSEVEWKFASPVFPEAGKDSGSINFVTEPKVKKNTGSAAVEKKLKEIIIPGVEIESTLRNAIDTLREETLKNDPAKVGINFVYLDKNVVRAEAKPIEGAVKAGDAENPDAAAAPAAAAPAAAAPAAAAEGEEAAEDNANAAAAEPAQEEIVKVNLRNCSPMEILRQLKEEHDVKFKIADGYVIVAPKNVMLGDMESRVINVEIKDFDSDDALKGRLVDKGISFGAGSSIVYDSNLRCVYVTNTPENIDATEKFLEEEYNIPKPMVQVMVKVIEMSQTDINELAFNWQYSVNAKTSRTNSDADLKRQTYIGESSTELLRYYRPNDAQGGGVTGPVPDSQLSYVWENSDGTKLVANMFALNWADSGDVLYSPRVTVMDNQMATVVMGTQRYFPEDWELLDITIDNSQETGWIMTDATPQPTLEKEKNLGIKLSLQPKIKQGRVVEVAINFPIETFVDWMVFDARKKTADGNTDSDGEYFKMPIFNKREINTVVQVYDGDTVLVGGVSTDLTKTYHDKIPILGDIPFIGRFFQSRYSEAEKGNMLIFVTCRIVKPDGTAMYPDSGNRPNGVVNFGLYR